MIFLGLDKIDFKIKKSVMCDKIEILHHISHILMNTLPVWKTQLS